MDTGVPLPSQPTCEVFLFCMFVFAQAENQLISLATWAAQTPHRPKKESQGDGDPGFLESSAHTPIPQSRRTNSTHWWCQMGFACSALSPGQARDSNTRLPLPRCPAGWCWLGAPPPRHWLCQGEGHRYSLGEDGQRGVRVTQVHHHHHPGLDLGIWGLGSRHVLELEAGCHF